MTTYSYPLTAIDPTAGRKSARLHAPSGPSASRLPQFRALVLLSGTVRAKGWLSDIGRSPLDLPIDSQHSVLAQWFDQAAKLATVPGIRRLAMDVLVDRSGPMPRSEAMLAALPGTGLAEMRVERDPADYRGTGGVLRDLALRYDDDDFLLVATGAQVLVRPLEDLVVDLAGLASDVGIIRHADKTPAGLVWVRCGCLRNIPDVGFVDLKEQALPQIGRRHRVDVVTLPPVGAPLRTPAEYLRAVREYHVGLQNSERRADPFVEDWYPAFSVVEDGAHVDPTAGIHESVVLKGGRVGRGAVVVRSVIGPAGVVRPGVNVVQRLVMGRGEAGTETC